MKIYIAHSSSFDFRKELYAPIKNSSLFQNHTFIFPHSESDELCNSRELFQTGCDLIIAEVSHPSTGLGIELGWGNLLHVPIACVYREGSKISESLKTVTGKFFEYSNSEELVTKVGEAIQAAISK